MSPSPTSTQTRSCAEQVFASLSLPQRVGQLFVLGLAGDHFGSNERKAVQTHHFGSVSFVVTTTSGVSGVRAVARAVQAQASQASTGGVRFFFAANQEGGEIQAVQGPGFSAIPSATVQGGLAPADLTHDAAMWGRQLAAAGVNFDFAPVLDVVPPGTDAQNQPIGALHREYGHDPQTVATHGLAFLEGMRQAGIATSAKHFPGLGRVRGNTDFAAGVVDRVTTENDPYLGPFRQAIASGVPFVMVALATYTRIDPQHLAVFSSTVMRGLLRQRMGFRGVIISDDLGNSKAVEGTPAADRGVDFLEAGGDMIISKTIRPAVAMADAILSRAANDRAFRTRVNDAVLRILEAKEAFGLLPCGG
jgi:beta-N-acetylhexosaminidase